MTVSEKHKWRICPLGAHWRKAHPKTRTKGVRGHCVKNRTKRDQIYTDEILEISEKYFSKLSGSLSSSSLGFSQGKKFDQLILGWCRYWNDIIKDEIPLDPNLVKALIASESGFRATITIKDGKGQGYAIGLMQVTSATQKNLADEKGEIKDHYVNVDQNELRDPSLNIMAGIRWMFHKKNLLGRKLKRDVSWFEALMYYKGYKKLDHPQMKKLEGYYRELTNEKK